MVGRSECQRAGLWEIRSNISGGRIARVLFCITGERLILIHGFIKKTRKTPDDAMAIARARQKDVQ